MSTDKEVKLANKSFFDAAADIYEKVDHRRSEELTGWVDERIRGLKRVESENSMLLDLGTGTGLITKYGTRHFSRVVGVDISAEILKKAKTFGGEMICCDIAYLPFKDNSFDNISCFATLHHCSDFQEIFSESYRVLKTEGVFYTDHDLDKKFMEYFYVPMKVYRAIFGMCRSYVKGSQKITKDLYHMSEYHSEGIDVGKLKEILLGAGFKDIEIRYHWLGINRLMNKIIQMSNVKSFPRGLAPLFSMVAEK